MNPSEIIKLKRNKNHLSREQIDFFIKGYLNGKVTDYQMSAFLMSVYFNGMNDEETFYLTEIMLNSGEIINLDFLNMPKIDKHSTGGVGDKISLILAPLAAVCGIAVPMISGRGLGHTGGTLDKLESIPGFNVNLPVKNFKEQIANLGVVMIGQTPELAPADKKLYALRDVTATVECMPLIISSILSKKIAEGADGIVFDVKAGSGANLPTKEESAELAKKLISVSKKFGKKALAVITDMNEPLGYNIGNWLEVEECVEVLKGKMVPDIFKLTNVLTGAMIYIGGIAKNLEDGEKIAADNLMNKKAYGKFIEIVKYQNGNVDYIKDSANLKRAKFKKEVLSSEDGFISELNASDFGYASIELGCGRKKTDDEIDYLAGIILKKKYGYEVKAGDVVCELYAESEVKLNNGMKRLEGAISFSKSKPSEKKLIIDILE
ncbi:MAG: Pyrimidine-nucleoside phosphorylase [Ignavibacteria bacterium]|nr:Pyrimidine-nucleoside phosphorylase [Ignavibacteria bacterium]